MFPSRLGQSHLVRFPFDKVPQKKKKKKKKKKERGNGIFEISKNQDTQVICKHYAVGWPGAQPWGEQNGNEPLLLHKPRDCESFPFHLKETETAAIRAKRIERRVAKC